MSDEKDLRINSIDRFTKRSSRLLLQEYSHCEVPAGCGGLVLRWVAPERGLPVRVKVASLGKCETWVDGEPLGWSRLDLAMGRHVVAVHVPGAPRPENEKESGLQRLWRDSKWRFASQPFSVGVLSEHAGKPRDLVGQASVHFTRKTPLEGWNAPGFDDHGWRAAPSVEGKPAGYAFDAALESKQRIVVLPTSASWVRVTFTLSVDMLR